MPLIFETRKKTSKFKLPCALVDKGWPKVARDTRAAGTGTAHVRPGQVRSPFRPLKPIIACLLLALFIAAPGDLSGARSSPAAAAGFSGGSSDGKYIETLPGIRVGPASARQRLLNSSIINAHLAHGEHLRLHSGTRIEIATTIKIRSGGAIIGESATNKPVFFMPASAFDNRSDTAGGRYGGNAVGIDFSGEISGSFIASNGVRIENLKLVSEQQPGRRLRGILGRNVTDCIISNVEISGFPMAIGIALASARRCRISNVYIHDFADDTPWKALPQSTGIEIDNDIVHGVGSADTLIEDFRIERLRVGGGLLAKWGYQTDGINVLSSTTRTRIVDGRIADVGEGIDTFGTAGTIDNVSISDTYIFGLKFIHGASSNKVSNIVITNAGLAGVIFSGSDQASRDTEGNSISGIRISNIDPRGTWKANSTAGIMVSGRNSRRLPRNNQVSGAQIDLGPNGKYGWLDQSTGSSNHGADIRIKGGRSLDRSILVLYGGSSVKP